MKKWISILLCAIFLCTLASGCKKKALQPDTRPMLKVGMECDCVPYNWESYSDTFNGVKIKGSAHFANGYDTKIAAKIADKLDYRLVVVKLSRDELLPALLQGDIDLAISGNTTYNDPDITLSAPYYKSNIVVVVRQDGDYCDAESINDFQEATIAARAGTEHDTLAGQMPNILDETLMSDYDSMIAALQDGEIDGYIADLPVAQANCAKYKGLMYVNLVNNETGFEVDDAKAQLFVAMHTGSPLAAKVNEVISSLSDDDREKLISSCIKHQP